MSNILYLVFAAITAVAGLVLYLVFGSSGAIPMQALGELPHDVHLIGGVQTRAPAGGEEEPITYILLNVDDAIEGAQSTRRISDFLDDSGYEVRPLADGRAWFSVVGVSEEYVAYVGPYHRYAETYTDTTNIREGSVPQELADVEGAHQSSVVLVVLERA